MGERVSVIVTVRETVTMSDKKLVTESDNKGDVRCE